MSLKKLAAILLLLPCAMLFSTITSAQNQTINQSPINDSLTGVAPKAPVPDEFYKQLTAIFECDLEMNKGELISRQSESYGWEREYYGFLLPLQGFQLKLEKKQQNGRVPQWSLEAYRPPFAGNEQFYDSLFEKLKSYGTVTSKPSSSYLFKGMNLVAPGGKDYHILINLNKYSPYIAGGAEDNSLTIYVAGKGPAFIGSYPKDETNSQSKKYVTCSRCNGKGHLGVIKNTEQKRYKYKKNALGEYTYEGSVTTGVNDVCPKCVGKGKVYQ